MSNKKVVFFNSTQLPPYFVLLKNKCFVQPQSTAASVHLSASLCLQCACGLSMYSYRVARTSMSHSTLTSHPSIGRLLRDSQPEGRVRPPAYRVIRRFPKETTFQCSTQHKNTDKTNMLSLPVRLGHHRLVLYFTLSAFWHALKIIKFCGDEKAHHIHTTTDEICPTQGQFGL